MKIRRHSNPRVARAASKFKPWDYGYMLDIEAKCLTEMAIDAEYKNVTHLWYKYGDEF